MPIPNAFVSYTHDSQEHKRWVLDLATRLRNTGVDATLDQWDLGPGDDIPSFMERHLAAADRVLMVCTERYVERADAGTGGVGYEKMILTADLMKSVDSNKVIPLVRQSGSHVLPAFLKSKLFIDFSRADQFEFSFDELTRALHGAPLFRKPPVGNSPFQPVSEVPVERSGDAVRELMLIVIRDFERGEDYSEYQTLLARSKISRLMLDMVIEQAVEQGLVIQDPERDLYITVKGKHYAIQHRLYKGA